MSYYEKYLKYKNKYIQYKNKLGMNMQGGSKSNVNKADILNIDNLTATPTINIELTRTKYQSNDMLTATPHLSEIAGGAYKPKNKKNQEKLLRLLEGEGSDAETPTQTPGKPIETTTDEKESEHSAIKTMDDLKGKSYIKDHKKFDYFAKINNSLSPDSSSTTSSEEIY
jgi:hypothetical protein